MPIRDDDPRPAYEQLADELRQGIASGRWGPGDRLPSTRELSESYSLAAMTVRAAVKVLEEERLVVARQGRGVFVRAPERPTGDALAEVRDTLQETLKLLQGINDRLDRYDAARRGTEPGQGAPDMDPVLDAELAKVTETLLEANSALDAAQAAPGVEPAAGAGPGLDHSPPPPEAGPDLGIDL